MEAGRGVQVPLLVNLGGKTKDKAEDNSCLCPG